MDTVQTSDERTCAALELLRMLAEVEEDVRAGCIAPMKIRFPLCGIVCSSENNNTQFALSAPVQGVFLCKPIKKGVIDCPEPAAVFPSCR